MNSYNVISDITSDLSEIEEKVLLRTIKGLSRKSSRLLELYNLLVIKKKSDIDYVISKIYGHESKNANDAFRKLCDRFLEVLFTALVSQEIFDHDKEKYSDIFQNRKWVRSRLDIMVTIGVKKLRIEDRLKFIKEVEMVCRKFEFLEELIIVLYELKGATFSVNSERERKFYERELINQSQNLTNRIVADLYVDKFITFVQHSSVDDKGVVQDLAKAIEHTTSLLQISPLFNIQYSVLMLKLQYNHFIEDFFTAEKIMYELIDLTNNNVCIRYFSRIGQNYMNLAYTQFFLNKFDEAYSSSVLASEKSVNSILGVNLNRESCVFALIYLKKYEEADELVADILSSKDTGNYPGEYSKRKLMHAYIKFLRDEYKAAFLLLQDTKEIETDREGWNLGIRMLNIFLTLSTAKVDLADQRIGSMRKHIERTSKMRNLRKRDIIIFRILSHLSRSGFDFRETWEERQKDFELLRNGGGDYRWIPRSHELVIFDQWFESKMLGLPYDPVFPKPAESTSVEKISEN